MILETLLCILLYLSVIVSPGSYNCQQIDAVAASKQAEIDQIHNNPTQEQAVVAEYTSDLEFLHIYDDDAEN